MDGMSKLRWKAARDSFRDGRKEPMDRRREVGAGAGAGVPDTHLVWPITFWRRTNHCWFGGHASNATLHVLVPAEKLHGMGSEDVSALHMIQIGYIFAEQIWRDCRNLEGWPADGGRGEEGVIRSTGGGASEEQRFQRTGPVVVCAAASSACLWPSLSLSFFLGGGKKS